MKRVKKIRNNLTEILKGEMEKGKLTQKRIAFRIGVTEATLSDFINMKRSTLNIELINKIITYLNGVKVNDTSFDMSDIMSKMFEVVDTFELERYKYDEKKFYQSPTEENIYFHYSNNPNDCYVETLEVLRDGRVIETRLNLTIEEFMPEEISERFKKHENKVDDLNDEQINNEEIVFIHQFVNIAIYEGNVKEIHQYDGYKSAIETIEMLYL